MGTRAAGGFVALTLAALSFSGPLRAAECGNGIVDAGEACDYLDLSRSAHWQCCTRSCELVSTDRGDPCDAGRWCDDVAPFSVLERRGVQLTVATESRTGRGTLRIDGVAGLPPAGIRPDVTGIEVSVRGRFADELLMHAVLPGGIGWHVGPRGDAWSYRDPRGTAGPITHVILRSLRGTPDRLKVAVEANRAHLGLRAADLAAWKMLRMTVLLDPHTVGTRSCVEAYFPTWDASACRIARRGHAVRCVAPGPLPRCRPDTPDRAVRCTVREAAYGQELLFAATGSYAPTRCTDLPGFVPLPGVVCVTAVGTPSFEVLAAHPDSTFAHGCRWRGAKADRRHRLTCE